MKRKMSKKGFGDLVRAPAYPLTGPQLFQQLRAALGETIGFPPTFPYLGELIGENAKVTFYWFSVMPQTQLIAFLSVLERLPESKRWAVMNKWCRELPSFDNPRLSHDPLSVSNLEQLLAQRCGLTWIQEGTEFQRTFIITALGHSYSRVTTGRQTAAGMDLHEPRRWVPIEGVAYFREPLPAARLTRAIMEAWPAVRSSKSKLLLLNGIWSAAPELRDEIMKEASRRHVIVTVPKIPDARVSQTNANTPIHVVTIGQNRENEQLMRIKVGAL